MPPVRRSEGQDRQSADGSGLVAPGGPLFSRLAEKGTTGRFTFPRPTGPTVLPDMSSGLKTFAANTIAANGDDEQTRADIARAFEDAVVDTGGHQVAAVPRKRPVSTVWSWQAVSANRHLRAQLAELMESLKGEVFYPRTEYCTDNGAMIAYAGMQRLKAGVFEPSSSGRAALAAGHQFWIRVIQA